MSVAVVRHPVGVSASDTPADDPIARRLGVLEESLRDELAGVATVTREIATDGVVIVRLAPHRDDALAVNWVDLDEDLVVKAGHEGGNWELGRTDADVDFLEDIVRSVIAGRAVERSHPRGRAWT